MRGAGGSDPDVPGTRQASRAHMIQSPSHWIPQLARPQPLLGQEGEGDEWRMGKLRSHCRRSKTLGTGRVSRVSGLPGTRGRRGFQSCTCSFCTRDFTGKVKL